MDASLCFIGHIETPYVAIEQCPRNIQPDGPECRIVINKQYGDALLGLEPEKEILVLYWFEEVDRRRLRQNSRKTGRYAGVFALRTPNRPNPIGAAVLKIERIENNSIVVRGLDCLNETPLLDIKPAILGETMGIVHSHSG
jgi:tRNA-Thr(GGU) m(6)t(6)A37 methyltransferase TsaA